MGGGGGGGRKPRNFATFRLFPRAGAADPNDRVFVRVDSNDYTVPGFGDDDAFDSSSLSLTGDAAAGDHFSSASGPLPDHVRREILELGLPDDGYNYLHHLRELRPSAAAAASSFAPNQTAPPLPLDVKAYDASRVRIASGNVEDEMDEGRTMCKVAAKTAPVRRIERAVDPDIARLLDETDVSHGGSEDEGLEEDFVIMANRAEGDEEEDDDDEEEEVMDGVFLSDVEEEEEFEDDEGEPKPRVRRLLDEQFDLLALEEYGDSDDDDDDPGVRNGECELPTEVIDELKLFHSQNVSVTEEYRTPADFVRRKLDSSTAEEVDESANVIQKCAEYAERYLNETAEEEEVVLVSESSDESEVWDCETIVSTYSNLDNHPGKIQTPGNPKNRLPKVFPGETATTKDIIRLQGKERLPVEYLPQRKRNGEKEKKAKPTETPSAESFKKGAQKETKEEKKARKAAVKEEKREARKAKKELKGLYKFETQKAQKVAAVTGPASIRLM
ncbi:uncharacterized protein [Oryza sativa Japonica Group]|uniref:Low temperature viability protein, expressed n=3 Tax=Oryza sativa subsp. japonica TaxID=39947 RepID=Q84TS4_ORYSJ|nr:protein LTV1 homolog [Oryza sativa Japonica Group]KAB8091948.1 hypothetical protein EE612_017654 [Oryza sativa]AAO62333.1 unknown protein [Oryza sativa Japonica Group]ABF96194.1 Low temperature viability protein, expressed [Oryza sativa Japonica Group]EAZ27083.1 hypothetical protein OsJ_11010 [Oryza sativa Japonica Group]KAF2939429.1 hypothetical protein DAI22_03g193500 [Oryza sativa Japonica Group]|eukprot:NP_001050206.1 Os03g0372700 [Oryza sativa Japonica Group]